MITIEQLKDVKTRTEALYRYLDIENKKVQVEEEQLRTQAPGFWDDAKKAEAQMKKVKGLQGWIEGYNNVKTLTDELELAFDFYKDELVTEAEVEEAYTKALHALEELELKNMLRSVVAMVTIWLPLKLTIRRADFAGRLSMVKKRYGVSVKATIRMSRKARA